MNEQVKLEKQYETGGSRYANRGGFQRTAYFFYGLKWNQEKPNLTNSKRDQVPRLVWKEFYYRGQKYRVFRCGPYQRRALPTEELYLTEIRRKDPITILAIKSTFHSIHVGKDWDNRVINSGDVTFDLGGIQGALILQWENQLYDVCRRLRLNWGRRNINGSIWWSSMYCLGFDVDDKPQLFYGLPILTDLEARFKGLKRLAESPPFEPAELLDLERIHSLNSVDEFTNYLEEICDPIKFIRQRRYEGHPYCIYIKDTFQSSGEFILFGSDDRILIQWDKLLQERCEELGLEWHQPRFHLFSNYW